MAENEAKARIKINRLLEEAGWRFFDSEAGRANIILENNVRITRRQIDEMGEDFETTAGGFVDFLLLDPNGYPSIVLEAKAERVNPLSAKEQARSYALAQKPDYARDTSWLDEDAAEKLLSAQPDGNIAADQASDFIGRVIDSFDLLRPLLDQAAHQRGEELLEAHRQVRLASNIRNVHYRVEPQLRPDGPGIDVYSPHG